MLRRVRAEVLGQLPARTDTNIPVPITDAQADAHDELTPSIVRLMKIRERRPLTQPEFLRLMALLTIAQIDAAMAQAATADAGAGGQ